MGIWCYAASTETGGMMLPESVACGAEHALAVARGKLWGWGSNRHGQLGSRPSKELCRMPRIVMDDADEVSELGPMC
eukprot:3306387-Rhodomonas_salina.1